MKNTIKTFALFLTAGAMLASCDSYLDRQPDEPLTSDNIFKKQKTTLQYLTNIYSYQPDYEAPACVSNSNDILGGLLGRDLVRLSGPVLHPDQLQLVEPIATHLPRRHLQHAL